MNEEEIIWIPKKSQIDTYPNNYYYKNSYLGKGGFAKVYTINDFNDKKEIIATYACKIIRKNQFPPGGPQRKVKDFFSLLLINPNKDLINNKRFARSDIEREIAIHRNLHHENIIQFISDIEDSNFIYIILELGHKSVHDLLENKIPFSIVNYFTQLMKGVNYLHTLAYPIIHSDLKTDNLLIKDDTIKIIDFGLSFIDIAPIIDNRRSGDSSDLINLNYDLRKIQRKNSEGEIIYDVVWGTINYLAPEIIARNVKDPEKIDIWACGVILYLMLFKCYPFMSSEGTKGILSKIVSGTPYVIYDLSASVDKKLLPIVQLLLIYEAHKRPTAQEILLLLT